MINIYYVSIIKLYCSFRLVLNLLIGYLINKHVKLLYYSECNPLHLVTLHIMNI